MYSRTAFSQCPSYCYCSDVSLVECQSKPLPMMTITGIARGCTKSTFNDHYQLQSYYLHVNHEVWALIVSPRLSIHCKCKAFIYCIGVSMLFGDAGFYQ